MKKLIVAVLMVLMLSITALAGPYFSVVNLFTDMELNPAITIGYSDTFDIQTTGFTVAFDVSAYDAEMFTYGSDVLFGVDGVVDLGAMLLEVALALTLDPAHGDFDGSTTFTITGTPTTFLTLWGGVNIPFDTDDLEDLIPELGIECRW